MTVIWITGLSGAGKTILSNATKDLLRQNGKFVIQLDGDEVRSTVNFELGYSAEDRRKHVVRIQNMAKLISKQEAIVIVSALYFDKGIGEWNRVNFDRYIEVYIDASLGLLEKRDQKKLYSRFISKEINNVIGLDIPYSPPTEPHIYFSADEKIEPRRMALHIYNTLKDYVGITNAD